MIKKLKTFFFPDDTKLKMECMTRVYVDDGKLKINRRFYTFRSLFWHYLYTLAINPCQAMREIYHLHPDFAQRGAIAFDASVSSTNHTGASTTFSHTCTGSNLVLTVAAASYRGFSSCTYNNVSMTSGVNASQGNAKTAVYYLANPATGANNVVFTPSGSGMDDICAISFSGANPDSPVGTNGTNTATNSTTISKSITTSYANSFLVDAVATEQDNAHVYGADAGQTGRMWGQSNYWIGGGASTKPTTDAGSYTMGWTKSSGTTAVALSLSILEIREYVVTSAIKTVNGLAKSSIKTVKGLAVGSVKTWDGLA